MATDDAPALLARLKSGEVKAHYVPRMSTIGEIEQALATGSIDMHSRIKTRYATIDHDGNPIMQAVVTTPGRMLLADILPRTSAVPFKLVNRLLTKKDIQNVIDVVYRHCGQKESVIFCDRLMGLGFKHACRAGISFGKDDLVIPDAKHDLVHDARTLVEEYENQYLDGLITRARSTTRSSTFGRTPPTRWPNG